MRLPCFFLLRSLVLIACMGALPSAQAVAVVVDVPPLGSAGNALGFEFVSLQFNTYLIGLGDPNTASDYAANVVANDHENYTYLYRPSCGGSGRGGGYCQPKPYVRGSSATYSDAYVTVSNPPTEIDARFHFSAADLAGKPLTVAVQDTGSYSLTLTADAGNTPVTLGAPLANGLYTLEYRTHDLLGAQVTLASAVAEPSTACLMLAGVGGVAAWQRVLRRRKAGPRPV